MSSQKTEEFFKKANINFKKLKKNVYSAGFPGETHLYEIWVRETKEWVFFFIGPLTRKLEKEELGKVSILMARMNYEITFAKLYLSPEDEVVISIEIPTRNYSYELFEEALRNLVYYGEQAHHKIKEIIQKEKGGIKEKNGEEIGKNRAEKE